MPSVDLTGARALVLGGAGFIGSHLVDGLVAAGAERVAVVDDLSLGKRENLSRASRRDARGGRRLRRGAAAARSSSRTARTTTASTSR